MRVALVRPKMITTGLEFVSKQTPLNLCCLAAVAREAGADVRIWDFDVERYSEPEFRRRLVDFKPDIIGISIMTPTATGGARLAHLAKQELPEIVTVAGGPHASAIPEDTLREFPDFDIAVFGEGEHTLAELIERMPSSDLEGICGTACRTGTAVMINEPRGLIEDLDSLPLPARDLLPLRLYRGQSYRGFSRDFLNIAEVATSRGCPNSCIFCAIKVTHGAGARFRSAAGVIAELEHLAGEYSVNHIVFLDDTFTLKPGRLQEIMTALRKLKLTWNCTTRVDSVDESLLGTMVEHGCRGVAFGVESGSPRVLELIGKGTSVGRVREAFRAAHSAGVENIEADFILGVHPTENVHDIEATEKLIEEIKPTTLFVATVVPYPGTTLWQIMKDEELIKPDPNWEDFLMYGGGDSWRTRHFTMRQLRQKQRELLRKFYLSPGYVLKTLSGARSAREVLYYLKSGLSLLREKPG